MDYQELRSLMTDFSDSNLTEFELQEGDFHLRMARETPVAAAATVGAASSAPMVGVPAMDAPLPTAPAADVEAVKAPLVGIYYAAPSPDADPFVREGQRVHRGQVLCIIEAMKAMNEVKAPCDGTVSAIRASNGDLVSYGDTILEIAG